MKPKYNYYPSFSNNRELVRIAISAHRNELLAVEGVTGLSCGHTESKKGILHCIEVHLETEAHSAKLPSYVRMTDETGHIVRVPIRKIISGKAETHGALVGGQIANRYNRMNIGTLGYYVRARTSGEVFLMSCYHALRVNHSWSIFQPTGMEDIVDARSPSGESVGTLVYGFRNNRFDLGLVRLKPGTIPVIPPGLRMRSSIDVTPQDQYRRTKVYIAGICAPRLYQAYVYSDEVDKQINYFDGSKMVFQKLMSMTVNSGGNLLSPTRKGDSGALVFNENREAMGIIIAGDAQFSYAMHIKDIENSIEVDILK